ncbi:MAG: transglycosylase domain-containing protein [Flavobacteriales bacterium]|nr:transglycosylase domain-containing protein [Flavobacteriales bacterium]
MAKKKSSGPPRGAVLKWSLITGGSLVLALALLVWLVNLGLFGRLPTKEEIAAIRNEEATLILANDGTIIGKVFAEDRTNIRFQDIPKHLIHALVSTEDQRFYQHEGVDSRSYVRVFFRTILGGDQSGGGGSTLSQQLVKNLYGRERHGPLTVPVNKIKEALVAARLEQVYDKNDVLTLYLNSVPFGEDMYGVEAAAQRYFGKPCARLKVEEAAVLVGMLKANTSYNPRLNPDRSRERRNVVLKLMGDRGHLTRTEVDSLQALPLTLNYRGRDALDLYGYFTDRVAREARTLLADLAKRTGGRYDIEKDGLRIHTTLDPLLQHLAQEALRDQLAAMQPKLDKELAARKARASWEKRMAKRAKAEWKRNTTAVRDVFTWDDAEPRAMSYRDSLWHYHTLLNGSILMMEPATGRVRAYIGGDHHRYLPLDLVTTHRQVASTIKPVIYAAALEEGMDPCTWLSNEERTYAELDGWKPQNFDGTSGGEVAMWHALANSMNLPTVDLYFRTGEKAVSRTMSVLGLPAKNATNPSVALGAADISLQEIVRAYGAFAARGRRMEPLFIERITDASGKELYKAKVKGGRQAIDERTAGMINGMLRRAIDSGTGTALRSRYGVNAAVAGKTGTAQDYRDAWFVGYTPGLVIGSWVGARDPSVHFGSKLGTGSQLALPLVGPVFAGIERSPELRRKYLRGFERLEDDSLLFSCAGTRDPSAVQQLINDVFGPNDGKERKPKAPKDTTRRENILDRLFKRKER